MKQCIALAGLACLLAAGCAQSGLLAGRGCKDACHVATSRNAPRPQIVRNACPPSCGLCSCDEEVACGCTGDECCDACAGDVCCGDGCDGGSCNRRCRGIVDGLASGFCGPGGGMMAQRARYPEYPAFNQGPPTGQVAYPYYTVRGPRDFLRDKPPTIGPY